jgi:hypothetical protein
MPRASFAPSASAHARELALAHRDRLGDEPRRLVEAGPERAPRLEDEHLLAAARRVLFPRRAHPDALAQAERAKMLLPRVAPGVTDELLEASLRAELLLRGLRGLLVGEARDERGLSLRALHERPRVALLDALGAEIE